MKTPKLIRNLAALLSVAITTTLHAQTTAFTYQGRLTDNGGPANGFFDITFSVWTSTGGPSQVGPTLASNAVPVSDGFFAVTLDFGPGVFDGNDRWLDIAVRTNGIGAFTNLVPRQPITSAPYAITASNLSGTLSAAKLTGTLPSAQIGGTYSGAVTFNNAANSFTGNGGGLTNLNASQLSNGTVPDARLSPNVALRSGGNSFTGNQTVTGDTFVNGSLNLNTGTYPGVTAFVRARPGDSLPLAVQGTNGVNFLLVQTNGNTSLTGSLTVNAAAAAGQLTVGTYQGGTVGSSVSNQPKQLVLSGPYNTGVNATNGVKLLISDYNNDPPVDIYPIYVEDENNTVDFYLRTKDGAKTAYFNGNVGIGTGSPGRRLQVGGPTNTEGMIRLSSTASNGVAGRTWDVGVPKDDVSALGKYFSFVIDDIGLGADPEFMVQWGTGNVGIGTTNPGAKLDVKGSVKAASFSGDGSALTNLNASSLGVGIVADALLSNNVALLNRNPQTFTGSNNFGALGVLATNRLQFGAGSATVGQDEALIEYHFEDGGFVSERLNIFGAGLAGVVPRMVQIEDSLWVQGSLGPLLLVGGVTARVGVKRLATGNDFEVEGDASKTTAGSWLANSDARIKEDIQPIRGALDTLNKVRLVSFCYNDQYRQAHPSVKNRRYMNVVAQEFAKIFPECVKSSGEKLPDGSEILQVDPYPLTIYSAAGVQELDKKVDNEVTTLRAENAELKARLEKLEQLVEHRLNGGEQ